MLPFIFWCLSRCSSEDRHLAGMISHQKTRYAWKGALGGCNIVHWAMFSSIFKMRQAPWTGAGVHGRAVLRHHSAK